MLWNTKYFLIIYRGAIFRHPFLSRDVKLLYTFRNYNVINPFISSFANLVVISKSNSSKNWINGNINFTSCIIFQCNQFISVKILLLITKEIRFFWIKKEKNIYLAFFLWYISFSWIYLSNIKMMSSVEEWF